MTLADCGDSLSIKDLCAVLRISPAQYYRLKAHGVFPIQPLPGLGGAVRYSKSAVQRFLDSSSAPRLRRSA
jgi:hypothetical protein